MYLLIHGPLAEGRFKERLNRFEAIVDIDGIPELVHVPNTGRLKELLVGDAEVIVRKYDNPDRKTRFGLLLVLKDGVWVSIDSANVPNKIVYEALERRELAPFSQYQSFKREVTVDNSRFDFALFSSEQDYFIEVKGVTLVDNRTALFPDAPTSRGRKHLEELIELKRNGKGAGVVFIIQRQDADIFIPNDITDKDFGRLLRKAYAEGVELYAYRCRVNCTEIAIECEVPVILD
ncbi:MAG: DNA/RNA nuclease SfsA [Clostridia bacterium]|nr:DNA/RNA nuclease SfsA [Clostridia bacterium]